MVREVVRYQRQDPVFNWAPPNPSVNRPYVSAWVGRAPDIHVKPQTRTPRVAGQITKSARMVEGNMRTLYHMPLS